jgi:macrolide transport system ATP-binding/permease protein
VNGAIVLQLLRDIHAEGRTILMVTHDAGIAASADRIVLVRDGLVVA